MGKIDQENVFHDILEWKEAFLDCKNSKLKQIFPKEILHGFVKKLAIFPSPFLGKIEQENVLRDILEWNDAYLDYKNNNSKQWKNWDFSKEGTLWFLSKISNFLSPFFRKNEQQNVF